MPRGAGVQWLRGWRDQSWPLGAGTQWHYRAWLGAQELGMPPGVRTRLRPHFYGSLLVLDPEILNQYHAHSFCYCSDV
jgi:hypothetical protein